MVLGLVCHQLLAGGQRHLGDRRCCSRRRARPRPLQQAGTIAGTQHNHPAPHGAPTSLPQCGAADKLFVAVTPSWPGAQAAVSFHRTRALLDSDLALLQAVAAYSQGTAPFAWYPPPVASPTRPSVAPTLLLRDAPPATREAAAPAPMSQAAAAAATPAATSQAAAEGAQNQAAIAAKRQIRFLLNRVASLEADRNPRPLRRAGHQHSLRQAPYRSPARASKPCPAPR